MFVCLTSFGGKDRPQMSKLVGESSASPTGPHLRRCPLSLRDLFFYGIVAVTPSAPATVFGLADVQSRGHVVVTILAAMAAMVLTAVSYGRLASIYPSAGSPGLHLRKPTAFTLFLDSWPGWAMLLDYIVIPVFCVLYGTLSLQRAPAPGCPFWAGSSIVCLAELLCSIFAGSSRQREQTNCCS